MLVAPNCFGGISPKEKQISLNGLINHPPVPGSRKTSTHVTLFTDRLRRQHRRWGETVGGKGDLENSKSSCCQRCCEGQAERSRDNG